MRSGNLYSLWINISLEGKKITTFTSIRMHPFFADYGIFVHVCRGIFEMTFISERT